MQIVRTIVWVLLLVALLVFSIANWDPTVTVRIWPGLVLDTKIPVIVVTAFAIGFVPLWLYLRGVKWQLGRRIQSLESAARTVLATPVAPDRPTEPALPTYADARDAAPEPPLLPDQPAEQDAELARKLPPELPNAEVTPNDAPLPDNLRPLP